MSYRRCVRLLLALAAPLAACGSQHLAHGGSPPAGPLVRYGATRVWVFAPSSRRSSSSSTCTASATRRRRRPCYHRPWLAHLAREGDEVVYPAYEAYPGSRKRSSTSCRASRTRCRTCATGVPVAAIGYSRGGRLVVDYASVSSVTGLVPGPDPQRLPRRARWTRCSNLAPLGGHTKVLILAGDHDYTVSNVGANQLDPQLAVSGFPYADVHFEMVRSHGFFIADHLSVLERRGRRAQCVLGARRPFLRAARRAR